MDYSVFLELCFTYWQFRRVSTGELQLFGFFFPLNIILNVFPYTVLISFCFRLQFQFYNCFANAPQCYIIQPLSILYSAVLAVISQLWSSF